MAMYQNALTPERAAPPSHRRGSHPPRLRSARRRIAVIAVMGALFATPVAHADEPATNDSTTTSTSSTTTTTTTTVPPPPTTTPVVAPTPTPTVTPTVPTTVAGTSPDPVPTTLAPPTTPAPAAQQVIAYPSQIANILATIRYLESRGDYLAAPNKGRASGAYQFITSTWDNYGGYKDAYLAPPEVQDERAAADVNRFLAQWNNDVSMIPVMWYYPKASRDVSLMDIIPVPSAGNVLTVREYQQRWLAVSCPG